MGKWPRKVSVTSLQIGGNINSIGAHEHEEMAGLSLL
jgi:hypothetical protein